MACPQKENGYTSIATEIVDALVKIKLSGYEYRILFVIFRKTYGWQKKEDWISLSQFVQATNISRPHVCRALRMLIGQNIITKGGTRDQPRYAFQKNYDKWSSLPKGARSHHVTKGGNKVLPKGVIRVVPKGAHTKDIYTKETIQMKNKKFFVNQYRERMGKEPMETKLTEAQLDFFKRSQLIPVFQEAVNHCHSKSYFTNPHDITDLKRENSKINGAIKLFWIRCDKDIKKATEVIQWFSGKYGEWKLWSPMYCFRSGTVVDYENRKVIDQSKWYK